jgi:signal transduction histidine kinase
MVELVERVLATEELPPGIRVERVLEDVPLLEIDADQLQGALFNLVRNAVEAMPDGGTLRLEVRAEADHALVVVGDDGAGISPQVRAHLFEPLHSTKAMGVGLGLVTARTFVEAHGGRITQVDVPRGARFEIRLPLPTA